ncbi:polyprenyl synthetase family protein [Roseitranquillus sediminis]|uniref:polyprenyl synthetase family protein n=1 Tax=Roseitranquillus sediminis TaxID=2809051 RepID=UPI001D0CA3D0|nr:farnesyl diphosphate synthase [Roseitranquillus sediminis]MBM9594539.1 polyprenyl synthetase family protein [Roseitranquillus sediminis]
MTFADRLAAHAARIESHLLATLDDYPGDAVVEAMRYALRGGKRLRGFLAIESAALHDVAPAQALAAAAAVEALHAYSLVHDDLPCMDDDDLRRGRPTIHRAWDEATAVLAGDALQTLAFELAADQPDAEVARDLVRSLAQAAGARGMVLGQARDIAAEHGPPLDLDAVTELQAGKTGALIRWSAEAGPRLARADTGPLSAYADALGLAFQIADDLLDATGDAALAGKAVGKDAAAGKATFVSLLGIDGARARAAQLVDEAHAALVPYGPRAEALRDAARFVVERRS